jgi:hypothetical protein
MTNKVYKTAMGKAVDIGALLLQNENVRAVGNMGVNARGDRIDSHNRVIDSKNNQIKRQNQRQSAPAQPKSKSQEEFQDLPEDNDVVIDKSTKR